MKHPERMRNYSITEAVKTLGSKTVVMHTKGWKIARSTLNAYRVFLLHQWEGKNSVTVDFM
jgi:hypothetical protein